MKDVGDTDKNTVKDEVIKGGYETDFSASTLDDSNENIFDDNDDSDFDDHNDTFDINDMGLS